MTAPQTPKRIVNIINEMIEAQAVSIASLEQKVIYEKGDRVVSLFRNEFSQIVGITRSKGGRICVSDPLAYSPSGTSQWIKVVRFARVYAAWVKDTRREDTRPLENYSAQVDDLMFRHGIDRDAAVRISQQINGIIN